jgi:hypothetical protein
MVNRWDKYIEELYVDSMPLGEGSKMQRTTWRKTPDFWIY